MGWTYLVVSINGAAYTLNAYKPSRRRALFGWSFFASWITIELAPLHLIWQVVATFFFAKRGALRTTPGKVGLGLTIASWVGLAATIRQSYAARSEIREAMRDLADHQRREASHEVRLERHVTFGRAGGRNLRMDIMAPVDDPAPGVRRPCLLQVHGGAWIIGDKREQGRPLMREMASRGWVCVAINYRLSPKATMPDHIVDVKRAIAWIREHIAEYGGDPDFVCITGGSAGGHLSSLAALTANDPRFQPGFESVDTRIEAAVPFYGVFDFTNRTGAWPEGTIEEFLAPMVMKVDPADDPDRWALASPIDQVSADAPPFMVIHGDRDVLAPVEDARLFVEKLREVSSEPVYYLELRGAQHAFETFASIRANAVIQSVAHFLDAVHHAYEAAGGVEPGGDEVVEEVRAELGDIAASELN